MHLDNSITYNQVFVVREMAPGKPDEFSIAIRPKIDPENRVSWEDNGGRSRKVDFRKMSDCTIQPRESLSNPAKMPRVFSVKDQDSGKTYTLEVLSLDVYNKIFRERVAKSPSFHSDEEVQKFFLDSIFS